MALWSRPEPPGAAPAAPGEFEGRTAEEALAEARRALGPSAELRCWKTRRGGVAGFFATEVFVASVNPPAGALAAPPKGRFRRGSVAKADTAPAEVDGADGRGGHEVDAVDPPDPALPGPTPPAEARAVATDPSMDEVPPMITYRRPPRNADGDEIADSLAALANGTTDQLSLNFDAIPAPSFDEVLAEAEAAVAGAAAWSDRPGPSVHKVVAPPAEEPEVGDRRAERPAPEAEEGRDTPAEDAAPEQTQGEDATPGDRADQSTPSDGPDGVTVGGDPALESRRRARPKNPATPRAPRKRTTTTAASRPDAGRPAPQPIPDLFGKLRALGVPDAHLPDPDRSTLDTVVRTLDGLPVARPLPTAPGSVVAVVGTPAALARTIRLLVGAAPFRHGVRPDPSRRVWIPEDRTGPDRPLDDVLQQGDPLEVAGRVARRRLDGRPSLVTVEVVPGHPLRSHDRTVIASVQPDFVLGAIDASVKRADAVQWRDELGVVDALALWGLDSTVSPAELLGLLPVAFIDGVPATPLTWTLTLLNRAADGAG